jgi:hypothetical protein
MFNLTPNQLSERCAGIVTGCRAPSEAFRFEATAVELTLQLEAAEATAAIDAEENGDDAPTSIFLLKAKTRSRANHLQAVLLRAGWAERAGNGLTQNVDGTWVNAQRRWLVVPLDLVPEDQQSHEETRRWAQAASLAKRRESLAASRASA